MSPDVEPPRSGDVTDARLLAAPSVITRPHAAAHRPARDARPGREHHPHGEHHVLRESAEDRWLWRAKIRRNPHQLRVYRFVVAVVGTFFIALGCVSGPLPGPGGIPLVLLGLAIWASEFEWAQRVMAWFKAQLHRFQSWSRPKQAFAWLVFFACCGAVGYAYLLVLGAPAWMPAQVDSLLAKLPGV
jgi:uncharacterized protein (TIGR02611 family)